MTTSEIMLHLVIKKVSFRGTTTKPRGVTTAKPAFSVIHLGLIRFRVAFWKNHISVRNIEQCRVWDEKRLRFMVHAFPAGMAEIGIDFFGGYVCKMVKFLRRKLLLM